jgi:O-antigen/teichoic acid export membrane protein
MMLETEALPRAERPHLRLRDCYLFFGPLVLMVELNMISKSVIHAFLARTDNPSTTLAAFNAAFTFYFALASATEVMTVLSLSYLKSRADIWRLMTFTGLVLLVPILIAIAVTFTPFGDLVFGTWFGLGPQAQGEARVAVGILALSAPVLIMRGAAFAQLMLARRTIIITWSTLLRLLSLTGSLAILPVGLQGATIGAGALVLCMAAEAAFAWVFAWRHLLKLPATREPKESLISYWRFAWPLIINQSAELGSIFVINLFLGRLDKSEIAIAAFGVVHGLISLMLAPLRTLAQSAQTLVARREDLRTMFVFAGQLIAAFTVLPLVLFHTPLKHTVLSGIMGLDPELSAYCEPAMGLAFVMALFWSTTALFRGLLARARSTTSLAASGVLRILTASTAGSISLAHPEINGAFLGVAAWILSYAIETAVSTWRLQRLGWYVER